MVSQTEGAKGYPAPDASKGQPPLQASHPLSCLLEEQRSLRLSPLETGKSLLTLAISWTALPTQFQIHMDTGRPQRLCEPLHADISILLGPCDANPFPQGLGLLFPFLGAFKKYIQTKTIL